MGTPAMTSRGFAASDFERVGDIVHRAVVIAKKLDKDAKEAQEKRGRKNPGSVAAFKEYVGEGVEFTDLTQLRSEVEEWVSLFWYHLFPKLTVCKVGTFSLPWEKHS